MELPDWFPILPSNFVPSPETIMVQGSPVPLTCTDFLPQHSSHQQPSYEHSFHGSKYLNRFWLPQSPFLKETVYKHHVALKKYYQMSHVFIKAVSGQDPSWRETGHSVVLRIYEALTHLAFLIEENDLLLRDLFIQKVQQCLCTFRYNNSQYQSDCHISTNRILSPQAQERESF